MAKYSQTPIFAAVAFIEVSYACIPFNRIPSRIFENGSVWTCYTLSIVFSSVQLKEPTNLSTQDLKPVSKHADLVELRATYTLG